MLLQCNMTLVICTSFYYNQNFIEKYICVQRASKNNTCHGQCFLMKKLKNQQEKEQQNFKVHFHEALAVNPIISFIDQPIINEIQTDTFGLYKSNLVPKEYINSIFRPPLFS